MPDHPPSEHFVRELTRGQNGVFAFILSLVGNPDAARDILQETNLVLWRKSGEFREGSNFMAWAVTVARWEVLAWRRDHARDRHVFNDDLLDTLTEESAEAADDPDEKQRAFEACLDGLPLHQRELLDARYAPGGSVQDIASSRGQSAGALSVTLSRIRKALADCITKKLKRVST